MHIAQSLATAHREALSAFARLPIRAKTRHTRMLREAEQVYVYLADIAEITEGGHVA